MNSSIEKQVEEMVEDLIHTSFDKYKRLKLVGLAITADDPKLQAFMKELFAAAEKHRPEMIEMKGAATPEPGGSKA